MIPGDWVEIGIISIEDGHGLDYANHIAANWRRGQEFAKQQNWISDYEVLVNTHPREGEPDIYLITRFSEFELPEEGEARGRQYREHMQRTIAQLQQESGERSDYRTVLGGMLLREMHFRD